MTIQELVKFYVVSHWGPACRRVGPANVDIVVAKGCKGEQVEIKTLEGGANLDLIPLIQFLTAMVVAVTAGINLYLACRKLSPEAIPEDKFVAEVAKHMPGGKLGSHDENKVRQIYQSVCTRTDLPEMSDGAGI